MENIHDLEAVVSEISYELNLWPVSPASVLYVGDERSREIVRRYLDYAKLSFVCIAGDNTEMCDQLNCQKWVQHQDLVIFLNLFTTQASSRTPTFLNMAKASLVPDGRLIALEQLPKTSEKYETLKAAADQGGMRLISALSMDADNRWNCLVFQNAERIA